MKLNGYLHNFFTYRLKSGFSIESKIIGQRGRKAVKIRMMLRFTWFIVFLN